jgi:dTDP-4-dehydrorhamnose 3,5-epimerase-like enzyme
VVPAPVLALGGSGVSRSGGPSPAGARLEPIDPNAIRIDGVHPVLRIFHHDARGFLVESLRTDLPEEVGLRFRMAYSSLTRPGESRDRDRWHVHQVQTDRFFVILGEMILALLDRRPASPTRDRLEIVRMLGAPYGREGSPQSPGSEPSFLVSIPPGVLHCIANMSDRPFLLQNFPTELYDPKDEGRVLFADLPIPALGRPFSWDLVSPGSPVR